MFKKEPIKVKSIEVWKNKFNHLSGIRLTLSNGQQSPCFKSGPEQLGPTVVEVDQNCSQSTIKMLVSHHVKGFEVLGADGGEVCAWRGGEREGSERQ